MDEKYEAELHAVLRETLEAGRQLGITSGTEEATMRPFMIRLVTMYDELYSEVTKLKGQLKKARKAAATAEEARKSEDTAREAAAVEAAATAAAEKPEPAAAPEKRDWRGTWRR